MIRRIWDVASQCTDSVYVVTPWVSRYRSLIPESGLILETPPADADSSHGPLIGFWQGLQHVSTEWVLVLACDLPNLQVSVLQQWINDLNMVSDEAIACLPRYVKGWEPLCGFYRTSCVLTLEDFINQGGRSFQRWLSGQAVQALEVSNPRMLFNCNTPDDLKHAVETENQCRRGITEIS